MPSHDPEFLTVKELCELYQLSERTIREDIKRGALPVTRLGGNKVRISRQQRAIYEGRLGMRR